MADLYAKSMAAIAECNMHNRGDDSHFGKPWMASHLVAQILGINRKFVLNERLHCKMQREAWLASLANIPRQHRGKSK